MFKILKINCLEDYELIRLNQLFNPFQARRMTKISTHTEVTAYGDRLLFTLNSNVTAIFECARITSNRQHLKTQRWKSPIRNP